MDEGLRDIISAMRQIHGIDISVYDENFLRKSIDRRWIETNTANFEEYVCYLEKDNREADALRDSLHISFSQFFRDPVTFAILEQRILPDIIASRRNGSEIRVWSAGCANGQEAYSIAILLSDLAYAADMKLRFRIFATDISQEALTAGETGIYDESMILNVKTKHLNKYFTRQSRMYAIIPELKQHVIFSAYDLLTLTTSNPPESIYGDYDLVLCSNVLIYYKHKVQQTIIEKLQKAMSPSGYLVTGETETGLVQASTNLQMLTTSTAIFKNNKRR